MARVLWYEYFNTHMTIYRSDCVLCQGAVVRALSAPQDLDVIYARLLQCDVRLCYIHYTYDVMHK